MADLAQDTSVTALGEGRYEGELSEDWAIWGPMGGYAAALALRAAGQACGRARPASINVSFLAAGAFDAVTVEVDTLRTTRVATGVRATLRQGDRALLEALVWGTDTAEGLSHVGTDAAPPVEDPHAYPTFLDRLATAGEDSPYPFWHRLDYRPTGWIEHWDDRDPGEPESIAWYRFPAGSYDDPWLDACRTLIVSDLDAWGAATQPHVGQLDWFAPTIELTCRFLQPTGGHEWLLDRGTAPVAHDGVIGVDSRTWTADGRLVAIGGSTLLCRPAPG